MLSPPFFPLLPKWNGDNRGSDPDTKIDWTETYNTPRPECCKHPKPKFEEGNWVEGRKNEQNMTTPPRKGVGRFSFPQRRWKENKNTRFVPFRALHFPKWCDFWEPLIWNRLFWPDFQKQSISMDVSLGGGGNKNQPTIMTKTLSWLRRQNLPICGGGGTRSLGPKSEARVPRTAGQRIV